MKKLVVFLLVLCMAVGLVGCNKLPDPAEALKLTLDGVEAGGDEYIDLMLPQLEIDSVLEQFPALQEQAKTLVKTVLSQYDFVIGEATVDQNAGTAVVPVEVSALSATAFEAAFSDEFAVYLQGIIDSEQIISEEETYAKMFEIMTAVYSDATLERVTETVDVNLTYDSENKVWSIDNFGDLLI